MNIDHGFQQYNPYSGMQKPLIDEIGLRANASYSTDIQSNPQAFSMGATAPYYNPTFSYQKHPMHPMRLPVTTSSPIAPQPMSDYKPFVANPVAHVNNNPNIKLKLQDMQLWKSFHAVGTEMIITKTGRLV